MLALIFLSLALFPLNALVRRHSRAGDNLSMRRALEMEETIEREISPRESAALRRNVLLSAALCGAAFHAWGGATTLLLGATVFLGVRCARRRSVRRIERRLERQIDFYLPLVMEKLLMGVQSGLDIVPAIGAIASNVERAQNEGEPVDPVSRKLGDLHSLIAGGLSFDEGVDAILGGGDSRALRHALVHLSRAQSLGGALTKPLGELSDAAQLRFQEMIEEDIARLPARAVLPILCTFAGLILCFLATPLVRLLTMTAGTQIGQ